MHTCKTCQEQKETKDFYRVSKFTDTECKACAKIKRQSRRKRKPRLTATNPADNKVCNSCLKEKSKTEFYFVIKSNRYRSTCVQCRNKEKDTIEVKKYSCHICGLESKLNSLLARHYSVQHGSIEKEKYKEDLLSANGRPPNVCPICNIKTSIPKGEFEYPKYHKECYVNNKLQKENNPNYKNSKQKYNCITCSKEIEIFNSQKNVNTFCSTSCSRKFYTKEENRTPAMIEAFAKLSTTARAMNSDPEIRAKIAAGQAIAFKDRASKLEKDIFNQISTRYPNAQHSVNIDFYVVDILINNTVVEVQGDYWHNLEKQKVKDKAKNKFLTGKGYDIVYIWEHEWHSAADKDSLIGDKLSHLKEKLDN